MTNTTIFGRYFCGNEISEYGREHGRVDYRTLAKAFDAVLNNDIVGITGWENWEIENGEFEYYEDNNGDTYSYDAAQERISELEDQQLELDEDSDEWLELQEDIDRLNDTHYSDVFQWYIINDNGADILKTYTDEIVMYNSDLDLYVWGVTHYGTSWDYVLTDIPCEKITK